MQIPALVIVGGFLGSGKTTLILKAAELLRARGKRAVMIFNDQDAGLVDMQHALARNLIAREIADGCFCCRFSEFAAAAIDVAATQPDVIFAEPVGSCIDLAGTVMRPVQQLYSEQMRLAPLTVLLDPLRSGMSDVDIHYLRAHQLAEADLVCTTKQDLCPEPVGLGMPLDFHVSGTTGFGVNEWLKEVLEPTRIIGARLLEVDYARYADAEAALGWLNLHARIELVSAVSPALLCGPLLDSVENSLTSAGIVIAHLKVFDRCAGGWIKASVCSNGAEPIAEGDLLAGAAQQHELALNLRAVADPGRLQEIVTSALAQVPGAMRILHLKAFKPPAPVPEFRR